MFAVVTTSVAFWILLFRVGIVYAELFTALLHAYLSPSPGPTVTVSPRSPVSQRSPPSRRTSRSSSAGSDLMSGSKLKSQSSATLPISMPLRDYEGVGGWRLQADDDEEALWMNINSRLELPAEQQQRYQRSLTSGSRAPSGMASPESVRTPLTIRTPGRRGPGDTTASPEEYFNQPLTVISINDRGSRVSFQDRRRSGSSSTTSVQSVKPTGQDAT
ncbi:hypothetical protein LTR36_007322 [Oleoguttula mirabilis]|uniref:Uncharacterized protein n=1 Tax=Oleoguttula mirabilis TaxID=1507867 RepID=A0AAV9JAK3_9PEZI|nr:hypothetical protein LTR36_007322 [Oleoguttula mirabilis]